MTDEEKRVKLEAAATEWLRNRHCTLWGQTFVLSGNQEELPAAAEWLTTQVLGVLEGTDMTLEHWPTCAGCGVSAPDVKKRKGHAKPRCAKCAKPAKV